MDAFCRQSINKFSFEAKKSFKTKRLSKGFKVPLDIVDLKPTINSWSVLGSWNIVILTGNRKVSYFI